jgi:anti-sigma factor RsiW
MSRREHLNEDLVLDAVYGIVSQDAEEHLRACPDCAVRVREWKRRRALGTGSAELSNDFLAAQRREIYQRLSEKPSRVRVWAPVLASACAFTVGILVYHPGTKPNPAINAEVNDAQLFTDVFSMEQSLEPSAAASVRVLFEEQQQ